MDGVSKLQLNGREARFLFRGDINGIFQRIQGMTLTNILAEDPDLEEIFLHYYQKEG